MGNIGAGAEEIEGGAALMCRAFSKHYGLPQRLAEAFVSNLM